MFADEVRSAIVTKVKYAKYFSVILDCTPNASNEEQMSLVIRCMDNSVDSPMVQEYWIDFLKVHDASGFGLFVELKNVLKNLELDIDIDNIRGQGYDNGANMSGRHRGVQKRLLEINPRAFYTPCGYHSLNPTSCDMENCCSKAMSFFGVIQRIYTVFSSSPKQWKFFKDKVQGLTLKPLLQIRWESHVENVKPIKKQSVQVRDTLLDLANIVEDPKTKTENMDINETIKLLQALIKFLGDYRESEFASAMDDAKQMASEMGIEVYLEHNGHSDIIGDDFCSELIVLRCYLTSETKRAIDVLYYFKKMNSCFSNVCIAYKILLTIPVTVATAERSFSKLKLIKAYIRSTMSWQILNGLTMLSIEKEIVEQLDYTKLIDIFASKTAKQVLWNLFPCLVRRSWCYGGDVVAMVCSDVVVMLVIWFGGNNVGVGDCGYVVVMSRMEWGICNQ
ncbi:uncharacterized protein LOC111377737 [Olea europaea var. sylvestris]|uniref:uncharacterized protein LOC111377737 n=1 Tax=Olea europaea var. sylvestris TaxID=158386 RepID=UPI000C1CCE86|nr:uncharacterized protein LOC111377737 [Olea europaea var. sylvestris]